MSTSEPAAGPPGSVGRSPIRLLLPVVVILVILGGATILIAGGASKQALPGNAASRHSPAFYGLALNPPEPAPALSTLRNYDGSSFNLAADRGKAVFVTFLYSHCPDVCPLIAASLHNTYAKLSPAMRKRVDIVAVSVDPHGDSAAAVASFMRAHQLAGEGRYLIGSASQLVPVWKAWNVGSEKDVSSPDLVNHSALIYGIGADQHIYTIYSSNFEPGQIIHDLPALLAR
ncbi:MAG TPA: SCO family protein [Solirubrobacteraceae bacterium]|jgi:protein SCO1/2|nr:SCO family protein [Solirubrobacteraceae bacterium]